VSTILVTGGAGFIGSHLCDVYLKLGWRVLALDDLSTGRLRNLQAAKQSPNFEFVKGDVADEGLVERLVARSDLVVHLAARVGLKLVIESPLKTLETNAKGGETILRQAARRGVLTVIASTSEVYGLTTKFPSGEDDPISLGSPEVGRWSYAASKAYDESLALAHYRESGLPVVVARLFNTVGSRQSTRYGMVIPRFARQALDGKPLTVYGDGRQTRCFGHVADAIDCLIKLTLEPRAWGKVFNIGNPQEIRILELANRILEATESSASIEYVPFGAAYGKGFEEIMRRVPDISRARDLVGFEPRKSLDDVLRDVIEEQREEFAVSLSA